MIQVKDDGFDQSGSSASGKEFFNFRYSLKIELTGIRWERCKEKREAKDDVQG